MRTTYITAALAAFLSGSEALTAHRMHHKKQNEYVGVRFAEGMSGDETLGETINFMEARTEPKEDRSTNGKINPPAPDPVPWCVAGPGGNVANCAPQPRSYTYP